MLATQQDGKIESQCFLISIAIKADLQEKIKKNKMVYSKKQWKWTWDLFQKRNQQ